jgi:hypothetical protein
VVPGFLNSLPYLDISKTAEVTQDCSTFLPQIRDFLRPLEHATAIVAVFSFWFSWHDEVKALQFRARLGNKAAACVTVMQNKATRTEQSSRQTLKIVGKSLTLLRNTGGDGVAKMVQELRAYGSIVRLYMIGPCY